MNSEEAKKDDAQTKQSENEPLVGLKGKQKESKSLNWLEKLKATKEAKMAKENELIETKMAKENEFGQSQSNSPINNCNSSKDKEIELWKFIDAFWVKNNEQFSQELKEFTKLNGKNSVDTFYAQYLQQNKNNFSQFQSEFTKMQLNLFRTHISNYSAKVWNCIYRIKRLIK